MEVYITRAPTLKDSGSSSSSKMTSSCKWPIINVLYLLFASFVSVYRLIRAWINHKRCITLPMVNCRPFSKSIKIVKNYHF